MAANASPRGSGSAGPRTDGTLKPRILRGVLRDHHLAPRSFLQKGLGGAFHVSDLFLRGLEALHRDQAELISPTEQEKAAIGTEHLPGRVQNQPDQRLQIQLRSERLGKAAQGLKRAFLSSNRAPGRGRIEGGTFGRGLG